MPPADLTWAQLDPNQSAVPGWDEIEKHPLFFSWCRLGVWTLEGAKNSSNPTLWHASPQRHFRNIWTYVNPSTAKYHLSVSFLWNITQLKVYWVCLKPHSDSNLIKRFKRFKYSSQQRNVKKKNPRCNFECQNELVVLYHCYGFIDKSKTSNRTSVVILTER